MNLKKLIAVVIRSHRINKLFMVKDLVNNIKDDTFEIYKINKFLIANL